MIPTTPTIAIKFTSMPAVLTQN